MKCLFPGCPLGPAEHDETEDCKAAGEPIAPPAPAEPPPRPRSRGGRPTKLDAAKAEAIIGHLKHGNYIETAAALAGVSKNTVYEWVKRGARERRGIYHDFAARVEGAQAEAENLDLLRMEALAAKKDFRAISWRLERRNPRRWGPQVQISVHQALDEYLGFLQTQLDQAAFERILAATLTWDGNAVPKAM